MEYLQNSIILAPMKFIYLIFGGLMATTLFAQTSFDIEGHRGCRGLYPENTIPAFIHAVQLGVNTLEMDIVVSKDGKLVISHDPVMNEVICTKPDGKPVTAEEKDNFKLYTLTYEEIKRFDCGLRGNPKFPDQVKMAVHKPLLTDVIDTVEKYVKEHGLPPVHYNIETKSTEKGDDVYHPRPALFTKLFYDVIASKGIEDRVIMQSFDMRTLQEIHKLDTGFTTALLIESLDGVDSHLTKLGFKPTIYSPHYLMVNKKMIGRCHALGIKIIPWTVNDEKKMLKLKKIGVEGLISDYPDRAIKALR